MDNNPNIKRKMNNSRGRPPQKTGLVNDLKTFARIGILLEKIKEADKK
jgi:hypothetical protein